MVEITESSLRFSITKPINQRQQKMLFRNRRKAKGNAQVNTEIWKIYQYNVNHILHAGGKDNNKNSRSSSLAKFQLNFRSKQLKID